MAVRPRGLTVTIDGDTTGLTKALQNVNREIKDTQSQLKDVDKLLKPDPTNTELLSQKQRLLGDAIGETRTKLDTLKTASDQSNISLQNGEITQDHGRHIMLYSEGGEPSVQNMVTLCPECHRDYHNGKIKLDLTRF